MKILIIGGNGTIGRKVSRHLSLKHEVVIAGRNSGDVQMDMEDINSIQSMYASLDTIDALACIAGEAKWAGSLICKPRPTGSFTSKTWPLTATLRMG